MRPYLASFCLILGVAACGRAGHIGKAPEFSPIADSPEQAAMFSPGLPDTTTYRRSADQASLWAAGQRSLLGDRRAMKRGDILTVVIEIDDEAEISNSSSRSRSGSGSESLGFPSCLACPSAWVKNCPKAPVWPMQCRLTRPASLAVTDRSAAARN